MYFKFALNLLQNISANVYGHHQAGVQIYEFILEITSTSD